jgi:hypothetical protein
VCTGNLQRLSRRRVPQIDAPIGTGGKIRTVRRQRHSPATVQRWPGSQQVAVADVPQTEFSKVTEVSIATPIFAVVVRGEHGAVVGKDEVVDASDRGVDRSLEFVRPGVEEKIPWSFPTTSDLPSGE